MSRLLNPLLRLTARTAPAAAADDKVSDTAARSDGAPIAVLCCTATGGVRVAADPALAAGASAPK